MPAPKMSLFVSSATAGSNKFFTNGDEYIFSKTDLINLR